MSPEPPVPPLRPVSAVAARLVTLRPVAATVFPAMNRLDLLACFAVRHVIVMPALQAAPFDYPEAAESRSGR